MAIIRPALGIVAILGVVMVGLRHRAAGRVHLRRDQQGRSILRADFGASPSRLDGPTYASVGKVARATAGVDIDGFGFGRRVVWAAGANAFGSKLR